MQIPHDLSPRARLLALALTLASLSLLVPSLTSSAGAAGGDPATGSTVELPATAVVLHVEAAAAERVWPHTEVWPNGSTAYPYPNISWGVAQAQSLRKNGASVHLIVEPGTYRETITVGWAGDNAKPLVIEAAQPGSVIVSGADVETRWSSVDGTTLLSSPWDQKWGLAPIPAGWDDVSVPSLVRRREAVFVDGAPLLQVAARTDLVPGTFVVDESAAQLIVDPPSGMADLTGHHVEVARRDRTLHIKGLARAVAVKGFVFEAAAAGLEKHMAYVSDSTNVLIEGNTFRHSSWGGLGVCCTQGITVRGSQSVANGGNGIDTYKTHNALIEGNHIAGNNVRGGPQGFTGWSTAGSKNLLLHGAVFRGNTYEGNLARGLWFDTDVQNVLVDGDRSCENLRDGLFVEAVQGPLTIQDSTFCDNNGAGIIVATSGNVRVERSILSDNRYGQLVFSGPRTRSWSDHVSKAFISMGDFDNWTLVENTLSTTGTAPLVYSPTIPVADWRGLLAAGEIRATANSWWRPSMDGVIRIQVTSYLLDEWRSATGDSAIVLSASPDPTTTTTTTTTTTRAPKPFKQKGGPGRK